MYWKVYIPCNTQGTEFDAAGAHPIAPHMESDVAAAPNESQPATSTDLPAQASSQSLV